MIANQAILQKVISYKIALTKFSHKKQYKELYFNSKRNNLNLCFAWDCYLHFTKFLVFVAKVFNIKYENIF